MLELATQTNCINVSVSSPSLYMWCLAHRLQRGTHTIFSLLRLSKDGSKNFPCCFLGRSGCGSHGSYLLSLW
jgi:hypothetical protein